MEKLVIYRLIDCKEEPITLTVEEMRKAYDMCRIQNCVNELLCSMEDVEVSIPKAQLYEFALEMRDFMDCTDCGYQAAVDYICEKYELWNTYQITFDDIE